MTVTKILRRVWWSFESFIPFILIALLVFGIGFLAYTGYRIGCEQRAELVGVESEYGFFTTCMWNVDGQWIPEDNYRGFTNL